MIIRIEYSLEVENNGILGIVNTMWVACVQYGVQCFSIVCMVMAAFIIALALFFIEK